MAVKPSAVKLLVQKEILKCCTSAVESAMLKGKDSLSLSPIASGSAAAAAAEFERAITKAIISDSAAASIAASLKLAATEAAKAYVAAVLGSIPAAEAIAADAAAAIACGFDRDAWDGLDGDSWAQLLYSLQLDLVKVKGEHKQLLEGWLRAEGKNTIRPRCNTLSLQYGIVIT
jgi:hypothetical protein